MILYYGYYQLSLIVFSEIRPRGAFKIPREGPVIFVAAPHHNQFVDPVLLMNQIKKRPIEEFRF